MADILALVAPFFGLIFLGYFSGSLAKLPESGLAWLNFFIIYLALPALFFDLLSSTPLDQLEGWSFIVVTTLCAFVVYVLAAVVAVLRGRDLSEAAMQGVAGSYSNIGYMGPGLTLSVLGSPAAVPTALIFCFDNALQFILTPILMAMSGTSREGPGSNSRSWSPVRSCCTRSSLPARWASPRRPSISRRPARCKGSSTS
jgi:malonate transporter